MANLCGFDVIGEISADTLRDMVNQRPLQAGNQSFYLLGGQFLLGLSVTIPNLGTGLVQVVCVVSLDPVVRTPSCRLTVTLSDGSASFGSLGVYHLGGTATLTAAVGFIPDTSTNLPGIQIVPAVLLGSAVATVTLDVTTSSQVDSTFGTGTAANLNLGLKTALETFIQGLGNQAVPAFGFQVVPGRDSSNPAIVTAFPQVMWIDSDTLGIFGFYRGAASGGDLAAKLDSDIVQTTQEFLYNQPGLFSVVEARRIAAVLSPEAFHLVIGCPLIRNAIIKHLLHDVLIGAYQAQVHNAKYNDFYNQEAGAHLLQFINDDLAKNQGESFSDAYQHSVQKIQGIANDDVNGEAEQELNTWLDSPAGQASIADSTPPSCGAGTVQVNRQHMPDPFGDVITMLNSLTVDLAQGHVDIRINAGGDLPVCGSYTVTQGAHLTLGVNVNGAIVPGYSIEIPDVEISTMLVCKLALDLLITFFAGITWGTVIAFGGFALAESIGEGLAAQTIFKKEQAQLPPATTFTPKLPLNAQLKDIVIDPSGITTIALIPRNQHFNDFRPRFEISITQLGRTSRQPDVYGSYHAAATKWGCPSGDFQFTRRFFESSFGVKLNAIDVPMPITVDGWQIEIGNFSYALPGVRDPRPVWSNEPQPIATPEVILTGKTWVPYHRCTASSR
jgi:hypothetical protein